MTHGEYIQHYCPPGGASAVQVTPAPAPLPTPAVLPTPAGTLTADRSPSPAPDAGTFPPAYIWGGLALAIVGFVVCAYFITRGVGGGGGERKKKAKQARQSSFESEQDTLLNSAAKGRNTYDAGAPDSPASIVQYPGQEGYQQMPEKAAYSLDMHSDVRSLPTPAAMQSQLQSQIHSAAAPTVPLQGMPAPTQLVDNNMSMMQPGHGQTGMTGLSSALTPGAQPPVFTQTLAPQVVRTPQLLQQGMPYQMPRAAPQAGTNTPTIAVSGGRLM